MALRMAAIRGLGIVTVPLGSYPEGTEVKHNRRGNLVVSNVTDLLPTPAPAKKHQESI